MDAAVINDLRTRVLEDKPVTKEELAAAIRLMVGERATAAAPKAKGKSTAKAKSAISLDDLVGE